MGPAFEALAEVEHEFVDLLPLDACGLLGSSPLSRGDGALVVREHFVDDLFLLEGLLLPLADLERRKVGFGFQGALARSVVDSCS